MTVTPSKPFYDSDASLWKGKIAFTKDILREMKTVLGHKLSNYMPADGSLAVNIAANGLERSWKRKQSYNVVDSRTAEELLKSMNFPASHAISREERQNTKRILESIIDSACELADSDEGDFDAFMR